MNDQRPNSISTPKMSTPKSIMRERHPDLFSDSTIEEKQTLGREVFEYHLDTLTARKQEYQFEHFCRKLAEKEICPNLRPQTGPTGGGDSKVDTETYPVSDEIAERWWVGSTQAAKERWAFAFSAKQDWRSKLRLDVQSILSTDRGYARIYFFTNQFVRDKDRASLEDEFLKINGIPLHIMDRSWLVDRVYEGGHLDLAIASLGIESARSAQNVQTGPKDTERLAELTELDKQVADPERYAGARFQLVEDCLRSAILSRGLERPRSEVEARFAQADSLAQQQNINSQRLRIAYNRAWTAHWWYEDYKTFNDLYDDVERRVTGTDSADETELLFNLWQLLRPLISAGRLTEEEARVRPRMQLLTDVLERIASNPLRINNALQARMNLALLNISTALHEHRTPDADKGWKALSSIADEAQHLGSFPMDELSDVVIELGNYIESEAFDALFDQLASLTKLRHSEGHAAQQYMSRALQKQEHSKPYEAIEWFGRAEALLIKNEYRGQLIFTLIASSRAYEDVGLLWAARNKVLAGLERAFSTFNEQGVVLFATLAAAQQLVRIELELGRVTHALNAMILADFAAKHLKLSEENLIQYRKEREMHDAGVGLHFLNASYEELHELASFPDVLERYDLLLARAALLFALGHLDAIRAEGYCFGQSDDEILEFFKLWKGQPIAEQISKRPILFVGDNTHLSSVVLGAELTIIAANNPISVGISESLLGAVEAFLATSDEVDIFPLRERSVTVVRPSEISGKMPRFTLWGDESGHASVTHAVDFSFDTASDVVGYADWLKNTVIELSCAMFYVRDASHWLDRIAGKENAFARSLNLADILTISRNLFGHHSGLLLSDWVSPGDNEYILRRTSHWHSGIPDTNGDGSKNIPFGKGSLPTDLLHARTVKHSDRKVLSPIDIAQWDRAKWRATLFMYGPGALPVLGVVFQEEEPAKAIFRDLRKRFGLEDVENNVRVTIVAGISKASPDAYAVMIGPNYDSAVRDDSKLFFVSLARINRMEAKSSVHRNGFIADYERSKRFLLVPAVLTPEGPIPFMDFAIGKTQLIVKQAWSLEENDPDAMVLQENDEPVVPDGVTDPPYLRVIARRAARIRKDE